MSASSLADLLASQLPNGLAARARTLLQTQAALDRSLPAALAGHVRVMQLEDGVLSLACDSGAVASRLRHQTDSLIAGLAGHGVAATTIRVSVRPELLARYVHPVEKNGLPPAALDGLAHLNAEIEAGPLKDALDNLLRHHGKA
ncbi:MAG: DciA family protein [Betaproteobacteria bacterium]|nr:DciA family protein [Betaproteobacteria bacterium]